MLLRKRSTVFCLAFDFMKKETADWSNSILELFDLRFSHPHFFLRFSSSRVSRFDSNPPDADETDTVLLEALFS